jgi:hypothetical protein
LLVIGLLGGFALGAASLIASLGGGLCAATAAAEARAKAAIATGAQGEKWTHAETLFAEAQGAASSFFGPLSAHDKFDAANREFLVLVGESAEAPLADFVAKRPSGGSDSALEQTRALLDLLKGKARNAQAMVAVPPLWKDAEAAEAAAGDDPAALRHASEKYASAFEGALLARTRKSAESARGEADKEQLLAREANADSLAPSVFELGEEEYARGIQAVNRGAAGYEEALKRFYAAAQVWNAARKFALEKRN